MNPQVTQKVNGRKRISDDDLRVGVERSLSGSGFMHLLNVEVAACEGCIVLRGRVPTYYLKQMAQTIALSVDGVGNVDNQIDVC